MEESTTFGTVRSRSVEVTPEDVAAGGGTLIVADVEESLLHCLLLRRPRHAARPMLLSRDDDAPMAYYFASLCEEDALPTRSTEEQHATEVRACTHCYHPPQLVPGAADALAPSPRASPADG